MKGDTKRTVIQIINSVSRSTIFRRALMALIGTGVYGANLAKLM